MEMGLKMQEFPPHTVYKVLLVEIIFYLPNFVYSFGSLRISLKKYKLEFFKTYWQMKYLLKLAF